MSAYLNISSGQSLLIMGPSGAGKTSLLRVLCGLWEVSGGSSAGVWRYLASPKARIYTPHTCASLYAVRQCQHRTRMHAYVRNWHARPVDIHRTGRGRRDHLCGQFLLPPAEGVHAAGFACRLSIVSPATGRAGRFGHLCRRAAPSRPAKARAREDGYRA